MICRSQFPANTSLLSSSSAMYHFLLLFHSPCFLHIYSFILLYTLLSTSLHFSIPSSYRSFLSLLLSPPPTSFPSSPHSPIFCSLCSAFLYTFLPISLRFSIPSFACLSHLLPALSPSLLTLPSLLSYAAPSFTHSSLLSYLRSILPPVSMPPLRLSSLSSSLLSSCRSLCLAFLLSSLLYQHPSTSHYLCLDFPLLSFLSSPPSFLLS